MVKRSYSTPLSGSKARSEKLENLALSESLDDLVAKYLAYSDKSIKALENPDGPSAEKRKLLDLEKESVNLMILKIVKKANSIFDNKEWQKTFILSVDEYLLNFLQLAFSGHRSPNSLEKMIGRKRRYGDFLQYRYKLDDLSLHQMEYSFIEELFKYLLVNHNTCENTSMKYAQWVKEIMDRVVSKGWLPANIFSIFKCSYQDPEHDWLSMQELTVLKGFKFEKEKLNIIRDIFLFSSFTGLSYQEIYSLKPADILNGPNRKKWICKNRQKTGGNESLPLLPLPLNLLEKYKNHPLCLKRGRLLPVPTNQEYNRSLKIIAQKTGFSIILRTH